MKPAAFEYADPASLRETLDLLTADKGIVKILAGGQSLVPILNFRLVQVDRLIDINNVGELDYIRHDGEVLRIGALVRQADLERSVAVASAASLLVEAVGYVGHPQIRNRGTIGGAVAHGDPAGELATALVALNATFHVDSTRGRRAVPSRDFFLTALTTCLEADEIVVEIEVPIVPQESGCAFVEFAPRHNDFALGGAAVRLDRDEDGSVRNVAIGLLAAAPTPVRADEAEMWLLGRMLDAKSARHAAELALTAADPTADVQGSAGFRCEVVGAMVRRALLVANERAT